MEQGQDYSKEAQRSRQLIALAKQSFDLFDLKRIGLISIKELKTSILSLGVKQQSKKLLDLVQFYQKEKNITSFDFDCFKQMLSSTRHSHCRSLFQAYDQQGKGFIDIKDLQRLSLQLQLKYSNFEHQLILKHLDLDRDGKLSWEDFQRILRF